jgi:hypothetical protein
LCSHRRCSRALPGVVLRLGQLHVVCRGDEVAPRGHGGAVPFAMVWSRCRLPARCVGMCPHRGLRGFVHRRATHERDAALTGASAVPEFARAGERSRRVCPAQLPLPLPSCPIHEDGRTEVHRRRSASPRRSRHGFPPTRRLCLPELSDPQKTSKRPERLPSLREAGRCGSTGGYGQPSLSRS